MQNSDQSFEKDAHHLTGIASLDFTSNKETSLSQLFLNFNPERFEPVTIKVTMEGEGFTVTLFANEKNGQPTDTDSQGKLEVKKFKALISINDFQKYFTHFAAVFTNDDVRVEDLRVTNK